MGVIDNTKETKEELLKQLKYLIYQLGLNGLAQTELLENIKDIEKSLAKIQEDNLLQPIWKKEENFTPADPDAEERRQEDGK